MAAPVLGIDPDAFLRLGSWDRARLSRLVAPTPADSATRPAVSLSFLAPDSVAIITGQQPAVGGGPLYSLIKIAHAIAIARALGPRAVPLFWCASEDHDLGEASHADLIDRAGRRQRFTADLDSGRASLRFRPAITWWDGLLAHANQHLGSGPGRAWMEQHAPVADEGMGAWMVRLVGDLFARHGLLAVEGHRLRPLWTTAMQRACAAWPVEALRDLRRRLLTEGATDAFGELATAPLFADRSSGRVALTSAEAVALLATQPDLLSPGAALRPVLQQAALPGLAYVGGPGELAYHRFITPLYAALGVPAPTLIARCSLTLVPPWVARGCERWQVPLEAVRGAAPSTPTLTAPVLAPLDAALVALAGQTLPTTHHRRLLTGVARLRRERERLAASLARADRQAAERPAWGVLQGWLHPRGLAQERTLSLFQAVWQFGPGIADRLVEAASTTAPGVHGWVKLE